MNNSDRKTGHAAFEVLSRPKRPQAAPEEASFALRVSVPGRSVLFEDLVRRALAPGAETELANAHLPLRWHAEAALDIEALWEAAIADGALVLPAGVETELWCAEDHVAIVIVAAGLRLLGERIGLDGDGTGRMLALSDGEPAERSDYVVGLLAILVAELNDQLNALVAQAVVR